MVETGEIFRSLIIGELWKGLSKKCGHTEENPESRVEKSTLRHEDTNQNTSEVDVTPT